MAPRVRGPRAAGRRDHGRVARPRRRAQTATASRAYSRWCGGPAARAYSPSAAVAALALAGHATAARARAAASSVDAVAAGPHRGRVSPHLAALHAAQRTGALDLHGLDPAEATRAVALVLDHRDLLDDVLIIPRATSKQHSQRLRRQE